jgi:2-polyprenyl-3-methyl-5-hydroxy-6-metoxy-1,4-benzoquinol methylase
MMRRRHARHEQSPYGEVIAEVRRRGLERLGVMTSWAWYDDPKRLAFSLARYKFVAKMLEGRQRVLEVGCGDGFGARVVAQSVGRLTAIDRDPDFVASAKSTASDRFPIDFRVHDIMKEAVPGRFCAAYSLDVLEHIPRRQEPRFIRNVVASLERDGVCIIGMPSEESQVYASRFSKLGHVNCKTQSSLKGVMQEYFRNVFAFSMNDEVIHTGYGRMSHYNIAVCCNPRVQSARRR